MTASGSSEIAGAAFDAAPIATAILDLDPEPRFVGGNRRLGALLGEDPFEFFQRYLGGPAGEKFSEDVESSMASEDERVIHLPLHGQTRALGLFANALDSQEAPSRIVVQFRLLTDQGARERELLATVERLRDLVDNSTALMYIKDLHGRYLVVNEYFVRMFGVSAETIVGRTDFELFHGASAEVYSQHDQAVIDTGTSIEVEEPFSTIGGVSDPDDNRRWLSIKFPLLDEAGRPYAIGAISTDISDRKRAESAARKAMEEAERANQSKNEFLSRISHELRTPLNAIIGFAQLLIDTRMSQESQESVSHILEAGEHLLSLVNNVLDLTWIEAGAPGIATGPVPAIEPIHQALALIRPIARANDIEIASDLHNALHSYIEADPQRLRQVFLNLLGNAVKFNGTSGAIMVRCQPNGRSLRFLITDTGRGIAEDDVNRLFMPFVRLPSTTEIEGTGLGLALSRRLVDEMGGSLGISHTAPGEGSTFYVDMPLSEAMAERDAQQPVQADLSSLVPLAAAIILHIEDTYANIRLVENIIAKMGSLEVVSATSGESGLRLAPTLLPQLILLDLNLADMSGVDVIHRLKADEKTRNIPIVVLSADATPARMAALARLGINDYLTKPLDIHLFAHTVRRCLT